MAPLTADATADVCVIGAGIAGLSTAYHLLRRGLSVIVLDRAPIGGGETGLTSAHLASALDDRFSYLERVHGLAGARLAAQSHMAAIDAIEGTIAEETITCGFQRVDGYLFAASGDEGILEPELAAAQRAGLPEVRLIPSAPLPGFDTGPCIRFPHQAQFEPLAYLFGLASAVLRRGGRIHWGNHVASVDGGSTSMVKTADGHRVHVGAVVVATNVPFNDRLVIHSKLEPYRSYVVAVPVPAGTVAQALFWDTADPYHYLRIVSGDSADTDLLLVGGEDHPTGQEDAGHPPYATLERWLKSRFPQAGSAVARWSGQIIETVDGLAYIGRNPSDHDNVYIITGDSGNGLTHGTIGGLLIADLITGRDNPWADLYHPARVNLRSTGAYLAHNANVAIQYADWLSAGDVRDVEAIPRGDGAVLRRGLRKFAVYRDPHGVVHACSATCPHLGGVVHWNATEHTWDCPCHGSRFDAYGRVLNGPANVDLERIAGDPPPIGEPGRGTEHDREAPDPDPRFKR